MWRFSLNLNQTKIYKAKEIGKQDKQDKQDKT